MPEQQWFVDGERIAREVITADIQRYLGPDALVRPGEWDGKKGYWVTAHRPPALFMLMDLQNDTTRWLLEKWEAEKAGRQNVVYQDSQTHASRQSYGPSNRNPVSSRLDLAPDRYVTVFNHTDTERMDPPIRPLNPIHTSASYTEQLDSLPFWRPSESEQDYYRPLYRSRSQRHDQSPYMVPGSYNLTLNDDERWHARHISSAESFSKRSSINDSFISDQQLQRPSSSTSIADMSRKRTHEFPDPWTDKRFHWSPVSYPSLYLPPGSQSLGIGLNIRTSTTLTSEDVARRCGWQIEDGEPRFVQGPAETILTRVNELGRGSVGVVDEVFVSDSYHQEHFVRKSIEIPREKRRATAALDIVHNEIRHMRSIVHPHVVKILGSYQEEAKWRTIVHLLMHPVGDGNLEDFFFSCISLYHDKDIKQLQLQHTWLRRWFGCLSNALAYLHSINIHHKDIKPRNVIYRGDSVYFTDFSSSRSFQIDEASSTSGFARSTKLYQAPEVCPESEQRHGSKADVYSLGLVFTEMLVILTNTEISQFRDWLQFQQPEFSDSSTRQYSKVIDDISVWFKMAHPLSTNGPLDYKFDRYILPMLAPSKERRPSAAKVKAKIAEEHPFSEILGGCFRE